ncbi:hypothetical protein BDQ17DRAFT_1436555 [Cyathus striatus]|nr:hypothetical protein BDQ17DRAFT_1436555 [Cyathus striatus]
MSTPWRPTGALDGSCNRGVKLSFNLMEVTLRVFVVYDNDQQRPSTSEIIDGHTSRILQHCSTFASAHSMSILVDSGLDIGLPDVCYIVYNAIAPVLRRDEPAFTSTSPLDNLQAGDFNPRVSASASAAGTAEVSVVGDSLGLRCFEGWYKGIGVVNKGYERGVSSYLFIILQNLI